MLAPATLVMLVSLPASAQRNTAPRLGTAPVKDVVAALTAEEKVLLVVGMGFYPAGFPPGMVPPGNPGDEKVPEKVPGAAGRTHAISRLGIPSLTLSDGPAGVRIDPIRGGDSTKTYYATAFPVGTLLASSWDTALVRRVGVAFGGEARAFGIDVMLAPGMNIHRNPLGGRNFEYYSEDPLVTGSIAAAFVSGVQSQGVGTSIKHFAANNQEFNRMQLNSAVSERALREIYLRGFRIAVRQSQPWTIMSSYNRINGTYTSESHDLLTALLRKEWGFRGLVMSDWFGGHDAVAQLKAGNDLLMPGLASQTQAILGALKKGALTRQQLDADVTRVLELIVKSPTFRNDRPAGQPALDADARIARQAAAESMVLLRNEGHALPLGAAHSVAAFGNTSYNAIAGGTGSGDVNRRYTISIVQGLTSAGVGVDANLSRAYTEYLAAEKAKGPKTRGLLDPAPVIAEMALDSSLVSQQARTTDMALVTLGRSAGEGRDRTVENDFNLTAAEQALVQQVAAAFHAQGKKVVVVLNVGGVVEVASWRDKVDAILLAWQPGQEAGNAVTDVLRGTVAPSGRLATTFPVSYSDLPYASDYPGHVRPGAARAANPLQGQESENAYSEGVYVGYRYFNTFAIKTAYEFGYGLGYTSFSYGDLKLSAPSFVRRMAATVTVTNSGTAAGREVVQVYLTAPDAHMDKPASELKAFAKTGLLQPGQSQTLTFELGAADLASFDTPSSSWKAEAGKYTVSVGTSSLQIHQRASFTLGKPLVVERTGRLLAPLAPVAELKAPKR